MADKKISDLTRLTEPVLADVLPIVNGGETKKTLVGDIATPIRNYNTPLTASRIVVSGPIVPSIPSGSSLGTAGFPFGEIYVSSGSINIASDTPGDPNTSLSNEGGNILISAGGVRLVESGNSFIAETGSFQYISGSMTQVGDYTRNGDTFATGAMSITGSFEASLQENYVWMGNANNISVPTTITQLATSGSLVQSAYLSAYSTSSQSLITSGSAQVVTFTSIWTSKDISIVNNSEITFANAGVYELKFVAQLKNSANAVHDAWFWIKYNGSNFPNSSTKMTLPTRKDSGDASAQLMTVNILGVAQNNNDYIQLYWTGDSTTLSLAEESAYGPVPETPSIMVSVVRVG